MSELLACDNETAFLAIEKTLGFFADGDRVIKRSPRPADYLLALRPLAKDVDRLQRRIEKLDPVIRELLTRENVNLAAIRGGLVSFGETVDSTIETLARQSTRGARPQDAMYEVVRRLRLIFRRYYCGPTTEDSIRGFARVPSEQERRELKFVETALNDARIEGDKDLRRVFRDSRSSLPAERNAVIERIAGKERKERHKKPLN